MDSHFFRGEVEHNDLFFWVSIATGFSFDY